jgi:hypothetical protein
MIAFFFGALMGIVWLSAAIAIAPRNEFVAFAAGLGACMCDFWFTGAFQ